MTEEPPSEEATGTPDRVPDSSLLPERLGSLPDVPPHSGGMIASAWGRIALYLFIWVVAICVVQLPGLVIGIAVLARRGVPVIQKLMAGEMSVLGWPLLATLNWLTLAATVAVTWAFARYVDRDPVPLRGFQPSHNQLAHWLAGFFLGGLFITSILAAGRMLGWYHLLTVRPPAQAVLVLLVALVIFLPAAAVEEITMRGYVLRVLEERYGWRVALTVSSLIFAGFHAGNPGFFTSPGALPGLLLAGVYLGSAYLLTRRLYFPIALHTAWNVFEGPVCGFRVSGFQVPSIIQLRETGPALWTGGPFGPEAGAVIPVALLVHLPLLWAVGRWLRSLDFEDEMR
jgi:CAAX protease family protein